LSNIVNFPNKNKEEIKKEFLDYIGDSNEISNYIMDYVMEILVSSGCEFDNMDPKEVIPHIILVFESIRSLYLFSKKESHPLQIIANEVFEYEND
jgi:hypothetical protein